MKKQLDLVREHLKAGALYRRSDIELWSNSVDRHLQELVKDGTLEKLHGGIYFVPKNGAFGKVPPKIFDLVETFLKDHRFVIVSPNDYNSLGIGTTQLYNTRWVYNYRRHGNFRIGNQELQFIRKPYVPDRVSKEFLLVDLINNLSDLEEDQPTILEHVKRKVHSMNKPLLLELTNLFGKVATRKFFHSIL